VEKTVKIFFQIKNKFLPQRSERIYRAVRRAGVCGDEIFLADTVDCALLARFRCCYIVCLVSN